MLLFQSTRPRGARLLLLVLLQVLNRFQSTRPRGARLSVQTRGQQMISFNPRAHAGRDMIVNLPFIWYEFSIHAHAGRDDRWEFSIDKDQVSIHAPTRGATWLLHNGMLDCQFQSTRPRGARRPYDLRQQQSQYVSIHAPTRGATADHLVVPVVAGFNPRAHAGRDRPRSRAYCSPKVVSIHAPTRGATIS